MSNKLDEATQSLAAALAEVIVLCAKAGAAMVGSKAAAEEPEPAAPAGRRRGKKSAPTVTQEEVREALLALNEAKGKQAVVDVLARFGVAKIGDLDAAQYAECKTLAEEEAAEEGEAEGEDDDLFN